MGKGVDLLRKRLSGIFVRASITTFAVQGGRIHDRFYLARCKTGHLKGVFGPSLNGLSGVGAFLMGDLEHTELQTLDQIIKCPKAP
jgi:hypothetical protein